MSRTSKYYAKVHALSIVARQLPEFHGTSAWQHQREKVLNAAYVVDETTMPQDISQKHEDAINALLLAVRMYAGGTDDVAIRLWHAKGQSPIQMRNLVEMEERRHNGHEEDALPACGPSQRRATDLIRACSELVVALPAPEKAKRKKKAEAEAAAPEKEKEAAAPPTAPS